jgi:Kef-type K+ transport system membrane component KefB
VGHSVEMGFLIVCVIALGLPYILHNFVKRLVPLVVVQIFVGVAIGPTLIGSLWPEGYSVISDPKILVGIKMIGMIAVTIFAYQIGMHIDAKEFQGGKDMKSLMSVAVVSLIVPLLAGLPMGWYFGSNPELLGPNGTPATFAFAFAILVAVTALPVLAATIQQMGYGDKKVGKIALFCATFNDGALWVLLAVFMAIIAAKSDGAASVIKLCGLSVVYFIAMWFGVRKFLRWLDHREILQSRHGALVVSITVCFLSALATHEIGLHSLLGAVFAGMVIPEGMKKKVEKNLGILNEFALLPFFFVSTGMMTLIPLASDGLFWSLAIGSTAITVVTKLWPTAFAAKWTGLLSLLEAHKLGSFMSAKGLMEIVVLTIMLQVGVISNITFGAMVVMALLTTALTMPLVLFFRRWYSAHPVEQLGTIQ